MLSDKNRLEIVAGSPQLLDGLYKVEYGVNDAFGRSVMCMHAGKLLGGNSAFAHLGTYQQHSDGEISAEIITARHNDDPYYKPLMGADVAAIKLRGRAEGRGIRFEGSAAPAPGAVFWADLTRLDDEDAPPVGGWGKAASSTGSIPSTSARSTASTAACPASCC